MTPLELLLDRLETAWMLAMDVPAEEIDGPLAFALFKLGESIEAHRPGLADRAVITAAFRNDPEWRRHMDESAAALAAGEPIEYLTLEDSL